MISEDGDVSDAATLQVEQPGKITLGASVCLLMKTETITHPVHGGEKVLMTVNGILKHF